MDITKLSNAVYPYRSWFMSLFHRVNVFFNLICYKQSHIDAQALRNEGCKSICLVAGNRKLFYNFFYFQYLPQIKQQHKVIF